MGENSVKIFAVTTVTQERELAYPRKSSESPDSERRDGRL